MIAENRIAYVYGLPVYFDLCRGRQLKSMNRERVMAETVGQLFKWDFKIAYIVVSRKLAGWTAWILPASFFYMQFFTTLCIIQEVNHGIW